jgi:hypothetical protein
MDPETFNLLAKLASIGTAIWAATEWLGAKVFRSVERPVLALIVGPVLAVGVHVAGYVDFGAGWRGWVTAPFAGVAAAILTGLTHDKAIKPAIGEPLPKGPDPLK